MCSLEYFFFRLVGGGEEFLGTELPSSLSTVVRIDTFPPPPFGQVCHATLRQFTNAMGALVISLLSFYLLSLLSL